MTAPAAPAELLVAALRSCHGLALVVTGAGVSAASGIRTFRGSEPDAVWRQHDVAMATAARFREDPVGQLAWYGERFATVDTARPNAAHRAIAELESLRNKNGAPYLLVTQNIDTLHEQAGSRRMIKVHGTADRMRCGRDGCALGAASGSIPRREVDLAAFTRDPTSRSLPRCPLCDTPLRPHVLFFDELYSEHEDYRFAEVEAAAETAEVILFVGTSFSVGVTSLLVQAGWRRGAALFSLDPAAGRQGAALPVRPLAAAAEDLLPAVIAALAR
jgi:NAD-dependent protein deacetylase/lipoamidase